MLVNLRTKFNLKTIWHAILRLEASFATVQSNWNAYWQVQYTIQTFHVCSSFVSMKCCPWLHCFEASFATVQSNWNAYWRVWYTIETFLNYMLSCLLEMLPLVTMFWGNKTVKHLTCIPHYKYLLSHLYFLFFNAIELPWVNATIYLVWALWYTVPTFSWSTLYQQIAQFPLMYNFHLNSYQLSPAPVKQIENNALPKKKTNRKNQNNNNIKTNST